jgi:hypothetical protein
LCKTSAEIIQINFSSSIFILLPRELTYLKKGGNSNRIISLIHQASCGEICICYKGHFNVKQYDTNFDAPDAHFDYLSLFSGTQAKKKLEIRKQKYRHMTKMRKTE